jgi:predicted ester cyclase
MTEQNKLKKNKAIVTRWFKSYWGNPADLSIVDELAAADIQFYYPMHGPIRGRENVKSMMSELRKAFPDLNFWPVGELIAEGDYVVGRWDGGGTHTGPAFDDLPVGRLPASSGKKMRFTGTTIIRIHGGKIAEEIGEEGAMNALQQLDLIPHANPRYAERLKTMHVDRDLEHRPRS